MRLRTRILGLVTVALALPALAACGAVGANDRSTIPANEKVKELDPYGGDLAAEGTPRRGGTLIIGNDREIVSFDPTVSNANLASTAVYDMLLKMAPDGTVKPYLAQSMETPDNGLTWRMGLRPGVQFSDGTPVDADAVIVNTQRHIDKVASPAHSFAETIASMRAVDPTTVEFTLKSPLGDFPVYFAQPFSATLGMLVSPTALKNGTDIGKQPVGTGPFVLESWQRDNRMRLTRNPHYWQQGMPYLDGIEIRPLSDTETRYATMQNGDVDMINGGYNAEVVRAFANPNLKVYFGPGNSGTYFVFNFTHPPFDDLRMRKAVMETLDLDAASASLYMGQRVPTDSLFREGSPYHTQQASDIFPKQNLEDAKKLVQEYVADGGDPSFSYTTSTSQVTQGEFVQAQMAKAGMKVTPRYYDLAQFTTEVLQGGNFELTSSVTPMDYPFPAVSRTFRSDGSANYGKYKNPRVDALIDDAAATTDPAKRTSAYQQIERILNEDVVLGWMTSSYLSTITKPDVRGIDRYITRDLFFANIWLDR
ncbi:ABC transporter substrate-binding protein [Pseudonocardia yunnanensis]|uniref:ABC transporter substrate-binding protein n=1 Tax=Pseudonocardia yunnanensis TaxID=58107 RepID=A0ABW4F082_9PSEU